MGECKNKKEVFMIILINGNEQNENLPDSCWDVICMPYECPCHGGGPGVCPGHCQVACPFNQWPWIAG